MLAWFGLSMALAQPQIPGPDWQWVGNRSVGLGAPADTKQVVVLGVHPQRPWVAYRRLLKRPSAEGDEVPFTCPYPGLDEGVIGVELGVFDATQGQNLYYWSIYAPAGRAEDCLTHEVSSSRLARAKAGFADLVIDISTPPVPATLASVGLTAKNTKLKQNSTHKPTRHALWHGAKEVYARAYDDHPPDYHTVEFESAYAVGAQHVVLECVFDGTAFRGGVRRCTFTPPLP